MDARTIEGAVAAPLRTAGAILPIRARGLVHDAGDRRLVDIEDLVIGPGGPTVVMGPNGAGKSLLLRILHGLVVPTGGAVTHAGRPPDPSGRLRQAMVFQRPVLLRRSVRANVEFALKVQGVPRRVRRERAAGALAAAGLADLAAQPARTLSGGEQQRLALVRALAGEPDVLFLDEPTSSLDPASTHAIETMAADAAVRGTKVVMVTHDAGQARRLAAEIVFLNRGRIVERAPAGPFFDNPQSDAARAFLAGGLVL